MRLTPVLVAAIFSFGCIGGAAPTNASTNGSTDAAPAGTWAQRSAVLGTTHVFKLDVNGSTVTGTGTYSQDGGHSGTLTETGTVNGSTLQLSLTYDTGAVAQFNGEFVNASELSGSIHPGPADAQTPAYVVTFDKKS